MCLAIKFSPEDLRDLTNLIPKEGKIVYKVVGVARGKYYPLASNTRIPFGVGPDSVNTSESLDIEWGQRYKAGFHFFQIKKEAEALLGLIRRRFKIQEENKNIRSNMRKANELIRNEYKVIECKIKKSWVTSVGVDGVDSDSVAIVTNKAIFPDPKDVK